MNFLLKLIKVSFAFLIIKDLKGFFVNNLWMMVMVSSKIISWNTMIYCNILHYFRSNIFQDKFPNFNENLYCLFAISLIRKKSCKQFNLLLFQILFPGRRQSIKMALNFSIKLILSDLFLFIKYVIVNNEQIKSRMYVTLRKLQENIS
jgi:hypothetical protein